MEVKAINLDIEQRNHKVFVISNEDKNEEIETAFMKMLDLGIRGNYYYNDETGNVLKDGFTDYKEIVFSYYKPEEFVKNFNANMISNLLEQDGYVCIDFNSISVSQWMVLKKFLKEKNIKRLYVFNGELKKHIIDENINILENENTKLKKELEEKENLLNEIKTFLENYKKLKGEYPSFKTEGGYILYILRIYNNEIEIMQDFR